MRRHVGLFMALLAVVLTASGAPDPYASSEHDPYTVAVTSSEAGSGYFTVTVTVTDKTSGKVVFAPRVSTAPGIPAEAFSEQDGTSFEAQINVTKDGLATVVFKAYQRVLQRSVIRS